MFDLDCWLPLLSIIKEEPLIIVLTMYETLPLVDFNVLKCQIKLLRSPHPLLSVLTDV